MDIALENKEVKMKALTKDGKWCTTHSDLLKQVARAVFQDAS